MKNTIYRIGGFIKAQPVLAISFAAAFITMFIIPPDSSYPGYINRAVLIELFALMIAVAGFRSIGVFDKATGYILKKTGTVRKLGMVMVLICFFSSMLVTNDVALLTFVPLTLLIYRSIPDEKSRILTIVLETVAANMGSMLTPVGNPQNLYLYDEFGLSAMTFVKTMLPAGFVGLICIMLMTFLLPATECEAPERSADSISSAKAAAYGVMFVLCLLTVFRILPDYICLLAAVLTAVIFDRKLLLKADYALLATFICFFVFVGNIARIDSINDFFSHAVDGRELLIGVGLSQIISNVPAAVMLAGFTDNGTKLLLGVDIGGLGTLIASLASLISFQFYRKAEKAQTGRYILVFTAVNIVILAVLIVLELILGNI